MKEATGFKLLFVGFIVGGLLLIGVLTLIVSIVSANFNLSPA